MKKIIAVILSVLICASFTSCAGNNKANEPETTTAVQESNDVSLKQMATQVAENLNATQEELYLSTANIQYDYWGKREASNFNICKTADKINLQFFDVSEKDGEFKSVVGEAQEFDGVNYAKFMDMLDKIDLKKQIETYRTGKPVFFQVSYSKENLDYVSKSTSSVTKFAYFDGKSVTEVDKDDMSDKDLFIIYPFYKVTNNDGTATGKYNVSCEVVVYFDKF